ncbi:NYN domain-containing protein [Phormidium pseudopriestleyi FRX01]|uniref:NYN domain-containing protein n=1 Tax=Phormidium pseudopriestleyi FRX01 TaxID=1759528 RepID=A0ABS3FMF6_9CYAN|nr:NYN domain-containing protein [Phormidium pseudopriestleyi]MBO0348289.1 NYN domain-containing protein [Phormidium pseudopriestleyi FRX01]
MRDDPSLTANQVLEAIAPLSRLISKTLWIVSQHHPEWLHEKFRNQSWHREEFQVKLSEKIATELRQNHQDIDTLIRRVIKLLEAFMKPPFFVSYEFLELIQNFRTVLKFPEQIVRADPALSSGTLTVQSDLETQSLEQFAIRLGFNLPEAISLGMAAQFNAAKNLTVGGIAILLLDAENLSLDEEAEKILKQVCQYDLQIKIAFANWQKMGKKDVQLHKRHYELIHVPPGKDSADVKMATVGSSIFVHYPNAKEVFVCSSDGVMTHLCTTLQTHGLTVYLVRKQGKSLTVLNTQTGKTQTYGMEEISPVLSVEECVKMFKGILKVEQKTSGKQWIKFSRVCVVFQDRYQIPLSQVEIASEPGKKARDIFGDRPDDFVVHQVPGDSELYIALFDCQELTSIPEVDSPPMSLNTPTMPQGSLHNGFNGREEVEQALERAIASMHKKHPGMPISTGMLGSEFKELYGQNPNWIIKKLGLGGNFSKFLQSSSRFTLTPSPQTGEVIIGEKHSHPPNAFTLTPGITSASSSVITTSGDLEKCLIELLVRLTEKSPGNSIPLSYLASEFNAQYGVPITQLMKGLPIKGKLTHFLELSKAFKLKKVGKVYQVALMSKTS